VLEGNMIGIRGTGMGVILTSTGFPPRSTALNLFTRRTAGLDFHERHLTDRMRSEPNRGGVGSGYGRHYPVSPFGSGQAAPGGGTGRDLDHRIRQPHER